MNSIQTLYDALLAFGVVAGLAVTCTLAIVAAGALYRRRELHAIRAISPAQQPSPSDDSRVLVLH